MCGINGYMAFNENPALKGFDLIGNKIARMNSLITHRGPDSSGLYNNWPVCFGFQRLSIIDLSVEANQPMLSNDGSVVIVFNGEIYNYQEIRASLLAKKYTFRTTSDTEVILNSYLEYGNECVKYFNGMWSFVIYDRRTNKLFCSRDRLGVKPFYYVKTPESIYFSSELKALHSACGLNQANLTKVFEYLAYGYRSNDGDTFFPVVQSCCRVPI